MTIREGRITSYNVCYTKLLRTWERRVLKDVDYLFLEVAASYNRYHTAMMRTAVLGEPTEYMMQAQERMKMALKQVKALIRPGVV